MQQQTTQHGRLSAASQFILTEAMEAAGTDDCLVERFCIMPKDPVSDVVKVVEQSESEEESEETDSDENSGVEVLSVRGMRLRRTPPCSFALV